MSGVTLGVHRVAIALVMSVALSGSMLAGTQTARADETELLGGPAPIETKADVEIMQPPAAAPVSTETAATAPATNLAATDPRQTAQAGRRPANARGKFEHWELAPTAQFTFSTGSDIVPPGKGASALGTPAGNTLPLDVVRLVGDARYRFNSRYALSFTRIAHTGATGRTAPVPISAKNPLGGKYSGHSEDYEERFLLQDQMDPYFGVRAGYAVRTRQCCPAAGAPGNKNPRIHTGFFSDMTWRTGPNTIGGKPWTLSFRWEEYTHHPPNPLPAPTAVQDSGVKPTFQFSAYSNFFFFHQTKLVPYYGIEYFSTYFSYSTTMTETYRKVYGVQYRATRDISWRVYVKNDQSGGILNGTGDSAHKSTLFVEFQPRIHW